MKLQHFDHLPDNLLNLQPRQLLESLGGPTVVHLRGKRSPALFVSVLQHGNEQTGWYGIINLLNRYQRAQLPRDLIILIANVEAAAFGQRSLDHQPDFNRCWPGGSESASKVHRMWADLHEQMKRVGLFASIDVHNNSGKNPHYAAITRNKPQWLALAQRFAPVAVYFEQPKGVLCDAFSSICPAITLECGKAGNMDGVDHCTEYLDQILQLDSLEYQADNAPRVLETAARAVIGPEVGFSFTDDNCRLRFISDIDSLNFDQIAPGTKLASFDGNASDLIYVRDNHGRDVTDEYLCFAGGTVSTRRAFIPSMLSTDRKIVRQDCLCYMMRELEAPWLTTAPSQPATF